MNKELIKKYFKEFTHWLNGGKIIAMFSNGGHKDELSFNWEDKFSELKYIIINDKYADLRKAGAEGKQLQVSYNNGQVWYDKNYSKISWNDGQLVRIKPSTDIKIGDFIYDIPYDKYYKVDNVLDEKIEVDEFRIWKSSINDVDYRLWKPEPGDLVVMETDDYKTGFTVQLWESNSKFTPVPIDYVMDIIKTK